MFNTTTADTTISRKRRYNATTIFNTATNLNLLALYILLFGFFVDSATWTGGPEDNFFCGYKWDDSDCQKRQHCPSGRDEFCEGFEDGIKCFANTNCDTKFGHGDWFVPGQAPNQSPGRTDRPTYTGKSDNATDHYWCGVGLEDAKNRCGSFDTWCPSGDSGECPQGSACYPDM